MACDTCGKTGSALVDLRPVYQTDSIKSVCSGCERKISNHLWAVQKMQTEMLHGFVKSFAINLKAELTGDKPKASE